MLHYPALHRTNLSRIAKQIAIIFFLIILVTFSGATSLKAAVLASSNFSSSDEGWTVVDWDGSGTPYIPSWQSTGGIPGGYLACPLDVKGDGFFRAPNAFHGNMSAAYGGSLSYDLFAIIPSPWVMSDIYINGGGQAITFRQGNQPTNNWQHFTASLREGQGWMVGTLYDTTGVAATADQIKAVLADVTDIRIRQEYAWGADSSGIDNVVLTGLAATPKGDINYDGAVDLADVILSLQILSKTPTTAAIYKEAEVNGDGQIGTEETIYALQTAADLRPLVMVPNAPAEVAAVPGNGQVTLSWPAVAGAVSYNVYYRTAAGVTKANGTKIMGLISGSAVTGLTNGTTYYFIVTSLIGAEESVPSAEVAAALAVVPAASLKWSYQLSLGTTWESGIYVSPALGADGTVYTGNNLDAKVVAMNPDGTKKWEFLAAPDLAGAANLMRPLTVGGDGTIYIASGNTKMFALNPDGSQKWVQTFADSMWGMSSGIAISHNGSILYSLGQAGKLYAVQASDGAKLWEFATGDAGGNMYSTPLVGQDGTIYFGGGGYSNPNKKLYAINPNGTQKWAFLTEGLISASPSIGTDGTLYIGSQDGYLYAVNPDGTQKWRYSVGTVYNSSAALDGDGNVYFGGSAGGVHSFDSAGNLRWTAATNGGMDTTPLIGNDGNIYVLTVAGYAYCFNQAGAKQWELNVTGSIGSAPVMDSGGVFYFGNADGRIYAVQTTARGIDASAQWPMFGGDVKHSGRQKASATPLPLVTTAAATAITGSTATLGGNVTSTGGTPVTARGLCWSTSQGPTATGSKTTDGSGTGSFTSALTGLTPNTTYYARAYATNSAGTAYGNEVSFTTAAATTFTLGQNYGGGLIFYLDGTGQHGLIAAFTDQSTSMSWDNDSPVPVTTNATGTAVGTGQANTAAIIAAQGAGTYAAKLCDDLVLNGYSDWFLPAKDELGLMYTNLKLSGLGGFSDSYYSSTEISADATAAYLMNFNTGTWFGSKTGNYGVRAVRAF